MIFRCMNPSRELIRELFNERDYGSTFFANRVTRIRGDDLEGEFEEWNDHGSHIREAGMLVVFPDRELVVARSRPRTNGTYSFDSTIISPDRLIDRLLEDNNSQDVTATITLRAI